MSDRLFLSLMAATAAGMIALALVWPQGLGARSPGPFGHTPSDPTPIARAAERMAAHPAQALANAGRLRGPTPDSGQGADEPDLRPAQ
jgi:hypothetical protein